MSDYRFGVLPVNYPDPDPDPEDIFLSVLHLKENSFPQYHLFLLINIHVLSTSCNAYTL